jgi:hypothetical protein
MSLTTLINLRFWDKPLGHSLQRQSSLHCLSAPKFSLFSTDGTPLQHLRPDTTFPRMANQAIFKFLGHICRSLNAVFGARGFGCRVRSGCPSQSKVSPNCYPLQLFLLTIGPYSIADFAKLIPVVDAWLALATVADLSLTYVSVCQISS